MSTNKFNKMKKQLSIIIVLMSSLVISSCHRTATKTDGDNNTDTVSNDTCKNDTPRCYISNIQKSWKDMTPSEQDSIIEAGTIDYENIIESNYKELLSVIPEYKDLLNIEKEKYLKYKKSVIDVASIGGNIDYNSDYFRDVWHHSGDLREQSFYDLFVHLCCGEEVFLSKVKYSNSMINQAYQNFINSINKDSDLYKQFEESDLEEYKADIKKEQYYWNEWMTYRSFVSKKMKKDIRKLYDDCTNAVMAEKLRQVKNQNRGLGELSESEYPYIIPEKCTPEEMLEYPGFDKVWAKHLENPDWKPVFEN